jgi:hypothetical protein
MVKMRAVNNYTQSMYKPTQRGEGFETIFIYILLIELLFRIE